MKLLTLACIALTTSSLTWAEDAPTSSHQLSFTTTAVSDYIFKGMTQTWEKPALQGSVDYVHSSGFYATLWGSTVSQKVYAGASTEIDLVAGIQRQLNEDFGYGVGILSVFYPGGNYNKVRNGLSYPDQKYDFTEANVSVNYKWVTAKYSYSLTDLLGFNQGTGYTSGTKGSNYTEINLDIPMGQTSYKLGLHIGHQVVTAQLASPTSGGTTNPDFTDYRVALSKTFEQGWSAGSFVAWNTNTALLNATPSNQDLNDTRDVGKRRLVFWVARAF